VRKTRFSLAAQARSRSSPIPSPSDILCGDNIEIRADTEQNAQNVVIEILVCQPTQHAYRCRRASNRARIPSGCHRDSLDVLVISAFSLRFARYAATSVGLRKQYPIAW
jgi:hypothetical protein